MTLRSKIITSGLALLHMLAIFITGTYAGTSTAAFEARDSYGTEQEQSMCFDVQDAHQPYQSYFLEFASYHRHIADDSDYPQWRPIPIPMNIPCPTYTPQHASPLIEMQCMLINLPME